MKEDLTPAQQRVLDAVKSLTAKYSFPPTRAELARMLGFSSPNTVQCHLEVLERKGWILLYRGARAMRVIP